MFNNWWSGYIGSQLDYILSDNNIHHIIIDNLSTGSKKLKNLKLGYIKLIFQKKKISKIIKEKY